MLQSLHSRQCSDHLGLNKRKKRKVHTKTRTREENTFSHALSPWRMSLEVCHPGGETGSRSWRGKRPVGWRGGGGGFLPTPDPQGPLRDSVLRGCHGDRSSTRYHRIPVTKEPHTGALGASLLGTHAVPWDSGYAPECPYPQEGIRGGLWEWPRPRGSQCED